MRDLFELFGNSEQYRLAIVTVSRLQIHSPRDLFQYGYCFETLTKLEIVRNLFPANSDQLFFESREVFNFCSSFCEICRQFYLLAGFYRLHFIN